MSLAGKTDLALDLTQPEQDKNSSYQEATPLPDVRGNGNLGLMWLCKNTEPKLTKVGSTHFHYHASIAGLLNHGIIKWIGTISINGKVVDNLDYTWNGSEEYHDFTIDTDGGNTTVQTSVRFYFGTETQTADSILNGFHAQTHPAYRGQAYVVFQNLYGGDGSFRVPNVSIQFRSTCEFEYDATTYGDNAFGTGINPVTHLHHLVTHPRAGLGIDEDVAFDMADMAAKYLRFDSEANATYGAATTGYINPQLTKNRKAKDWIKENLSYYDGFITLRNGKMNLDWFPHEAISPATPSEYTTIYQADLVDKPDIEFPVWENTISSVAIDFINIEKSSRKSSLVVSSTHNSTVLGENRTEQITRDWFWWEYQVQTFGERYLAAKESPLFSGTLKIKRDRAVNPDNVNVEAERQGVSFLPGHIFLWNYAPFSIAVYCRITSINPRGHIYEVSFVQERGTFPVEYIPTPDPVPDLTLPTPDELDNWDLVNLPPALTGHYKNYLGVLAERFTKKTVSWDITFNDSDTWGTEVAYLIEQTSFAARFEIQESVANEAGPTTFEILGSTSNVDMTDIMQSLDSKQAEDNTLLLFVGTEVMSLEANTLLGAANYDVTAYRARYGTSSAAYSIGQVCWVIPRADLVQWYHEKFDLVYTAGAYDSGLATKYFKTNTYNFYQEGTWSASQSFQIADQIPPVPTGLALAPKIESLEVSWTPITVGDSYKTLIQYDTASGFDASPVTLSVIPDGLFNIPNLIGGQTYYVRLASVDGGGKTSAWSSSANALTKADSSKIPDFSAYGVIGGADDFEYKINYDKDNNPLDGDIYVTGNYFRHPSNATEYVKPNPYGVRIYDYGASPSGDPTIFFLVQLKAGDVSDHWAGGSYSNAENPIVPCLPGYNPPTETWKWYFIDDTGAADEMPTGQDFALIAKGIIDEFGVINALSSLTISPEKPLELEMNLPKMSDVIAYDFSSVPDKAVVHPKGFNTDNDQAIMTPFYYDKTATDTADGLTIFSPTFPTTGKLKRIFRGALHVDEAGAYGNGSTDDFGFIQACIDWAGDQKPDRGGKVIIGPRRYKITEPLVFTIPGVSISGQNTRFWSPSTTSSIMASHTNGPAILIACSDIQLDNFRIDSTGSRLPSNPYTSSQDYATISIGSGVTRNDGIHIAAPDNGLLSDSIVVNYIKIERVHVRGQPGSGLVLSGRSVGCEFIRSVFEYNNSHNIYIGNGYEIGYAPADWVTATSYTANVDAVNVSNVWYRCIVTHTSGTFATDLASAYWLKITHRPGIGLLEHCRTSDAGGQNLLMGDVLNGNVYQPYRWRVINHESFRFGHNSSNTVRDGAAAAIDYDVVILGENMEYNTCACSGRGTGLNTEGDGLMIGGRDIQVIKPRFINTYRPLYLANAGISGGAFGAAILETVGLEVSLPLFYSSGTNPPLGIRYDEGITGLKLHAPDDNNVTKVIENEVTISTDGSAGIINYLLPFHKVDTESDAATDNLDSIYGGRAGDQVTLSIASASRVVTVRHASAGGNIRLEDGRNFVFRGVQDYIVLECDGTFWSEVCRKHITAMATELTIASGAVTLPNGFERFGYFVLDTEGDAATDDLDTITGGQRGDVLVFSEASASRVVTIRHAGGGTGNIRNHGSTGFSFGGTQDKIQYIHDGTRWIQLAQASVI